MNWSTIQNGWSDYEGDAKREWSKLSAGHIRSMRGQRDQLCARLQVAYSLSAEEAERQISAWQWKQKEKSAPGRS